MATYNSNLVNAGQQTKSIPPGTVTPVYGSVAIPANTTLATSDTLQLFSMPGPSSHIVDGWLDFPILDTGGNTIRLQLKDSLTSPTTIIAAFGGLNAALRVVLPVSAATATIGSAITYNTTNGPIPNAVFLNVSTGAGASVGGSIVTVGFYFGIVND